MDLIEVLPLGLYEMMFEEKEAEDVGVDLLPGESIWYACAAELALARKLDRIWIDGTTSTWTREQAMAAV